MSADEFPSLAGALNNFASYAMGNCPRIGET